MHKTQYRSMQNDKQCRQTFVDKNVLSPNSLVLYESDMLYKWHHKLIQHRSMECISRYLHCCCCCSSFCCCCCWWWWWWWWWWWIRLNNCALRQLVSLRSFSNNAEISSKSDASLSSVLVSGRTSLKVPRHYTRCKLTL